jgi:hypothetical protein
MATLTAHLRQSDDHGRLPFHPDCPICRAERLSGTLPIHGFMNRRTQAAIIAGLLAVCTTTPGVALAQEADQVSEGALEPEQSGTNPDAAPDFDPGGASESLPFDGPDIPDTAPDHDDGDPGALEPEPVSDIEAPVADAGDGSEPTAVPAPAPAPVAAPPSAPTPAPAPPPKVNELSGPGPAAAEPKLQLEATVDGGDHAVRVRPAAPATAAPVSASPPAHAATESVPPVVHFVSAAPARKTHRESGSGGERYHVVATGESLWSIARHELGGSASPARIAREVNRLWGLNSARIATGDPDLVRVGTKLVLR